MSFDIISLKNSLSINNENETSDMLFGNEIENNKISEEVIKNISCFLDVISKEKNKMLDESKICFDIIENNENLDTKIMIEKYSNEKKYDDRDNLDFFEKTNIFSREVIKNSFDENNILNASKEISKGNDLEKSLNIPGKIHIIDELKEIECKTDIGDIEFEKSEKYNRKIIEKISKNAGIFDSINSKNVVYDKNHEYLINLFDNKNDGYFNNRNILNKNSENIEKYSGSFSSKIEFVGYSKNIDKNSVNFNTKNIVNEMSKNGNNNKDKDNNKIKNIHDEVKQLQKEGNISIKEKSQNIKIEKSDKTNLENRSNNITKNENENRNRIDDIKIKGENKNFKVLKEYNDVNKSTSDNNTNKEYNLKIEKINSKSYSLNEKIDATENKISKYIDKIIYERKDIKISNNEMNEMNKNRKSTIETSKEIENKKIINNGPYKINENNGQNKIVEKENQIFIEDNNKKYAKNIGKESLEISQTNKIENKFEDILSAKESNGGNRIEKNEIINNIIQKGIMLLKDGKDEIILKLKPDFLGQIKISISNENNHITIKMISENAIAKEIIENNIAVLKNELQNHGIEINKMDIYVDIENDQYSASKEKYDNINHKNDDDEEKVEDKKRRDEKDNKMSYVETKKSEIDYFA